MRKNNYLHLPFFDRLKWHPICCTECEDTRLCTSIICFGNRIKLLLSRCIPQHYSNIFTVDSVKQKTKQKSNNVKNSKLKLSTVFLLYLSFQEVDAYCFFVVFRVNTFAIALYHWTLTNSSISNDNNLEKKKKEMSQSYFLW
jgi:hypothetical protein